MIVLDNAGTRALSLINTQNGANVEVNFSDYTTTTGVYARGVPTLTTISSGTTTSICATPAASTIRDIDYVNIYNTYAGSQNFTVQITSGSGGPFILVFATLAQNESLNYTHGTGWCALDANGNRKVSLGTILASLTVTGNATIGGTLGVTGVATFTAQPILSSLTASLPVFTDASKGLVSNTMTGSGSVVMSTSPQLTTSATTNSTTFSLVNATATTVNFAGGASTALNMGNASGTNTVLGATTFSQALTASSTAIVGAAGSSGHTLTIVDSTASNLYLAVGASTYLQVKADTSNAYFNGFGTNLFLQINDVTKVTVNASGMNGVLGATTPAALSATTIGASGAVTISNASSLLSITNAGAITEGIALNTSGNKYNIYRNSSTGYLQIRGAQAGFSGLEINDGATNILSVGSTGAATISNGLAVTGGITGTVVTGGYAGTFESGDSGGVFAKTTAGSAQVAVGVHNTATSGDNSFVGFGTEASYTSRGSITYNRAGGLVAYNTTSDYRSKTWSEDAIDMNILRGLRVVDGLMNGATIRRPMLIAHEAQTGVPWAVTGKKDAVNDKGEPIYQQLDHASLVPMVIAGWQNHEARIAKLEALLK